MLYEFTRTKMPERNPGQLSDQQYIDIIAYMLSFSNVPAGKQPLPPDPSVLANMVIEQKTAQK